MLIGLLSLMALNVSGQNLEPDTVKLDTNTNSHKDQRPLKKRISLGGSTGFWIQPKKTHVEVSVLLASRFPKIITIGPGYRYIYTRNRVYGKDLNSYGPNAFGRVQLTKRIYLE